MAAGIVASTLRRRTFRHKSIDIRIQPSEPSCHNNLSPSLSRTLSIRRRFSDTSVKSVPGQYAPKGAKVFFKDFWPSCLNSTETNQRLLKFESFENLIPKANQWLLDNIDVTLVKCETIEKKITSVDQLLVDCVMFVPKDNYAFHVKGLRIWFVCATEDSKSMQMNAMQLVIGYMNVIPKCLSSDGKYPLYENLPETYAAINSYLINSPLEGRILTIETMPMKVCHKLWTGLVIDPDETYFPDEYFHHILYITRIYFSYGPHVDELIGAQDFLPDLLEERKWDFMNCSHPIYQPIMSAMQKAKEWIQAARNIRITNIQTLEALFKQQPENVDTGLNFVRNVENNTLVRFLRITYVRPLNDLENSLSRYTLPSGFSYKTFIPAAAKVAMWSGAPEYESFTATWERSKAWLKSVDRCGVISVESFYHPVRYLWNSQDGGETSVMHGEWTTLGHSSRSMKQRRQLVQIVRVYLDGDFSEPSPHHLPPTPLVEEINDCICVVM